MAAARSHRLGLREILLVVCIDDLPRCGYDFDCAGRVRVAAERHLVLADGQVHLFACDGSNGAVLDLALDVGLGFFWFPRSGHG